MTAKIASRARKKRINSSAFTQNSAQPRQSSQKPVTFLSSCVDPEIIEDAIRLGPRYTWVAKCWTAHKKRIMSDSIPAVEWPSFYEEGRRCFCCGSHRRLQKCHIVPRSLGGLDEPLNIIPLCGVCHDKQPDTADPEAVWQWIQDESNWLTGLGLGHMAEVAEYMMSILKYKDTADGDAIRRFTDECLHYAKNNISSHGSQFRGGVFIKASTWKSVVRHAASKLPSKSPFI